jgi:hypothetical protein
MGVSNANKYSLSQPLPITSLLVISVNILPEIANFCMELQVRLIPNPIVIFVPSIKDTENGLGRVSF